MTKSTNIPCLEGLALAKGGWQGYVSVNIEVSSVSPGLSRRYCIGVTIILVQGGAAVELFAGVAVEEQEVDISLEVATACYQRCLTFLRIFTLVHLAR